MPKKKYKIGVIIYHRNILNRYDPKWIENCIEKIENQTFGNFTLVEFNFGGDSQKIYEGNKKSYFYSEKIDNLGSAISRAFDICFDEHEFDLVFNINLDDDYSLDRFEKQIECLEKTGADIIASNFHFTDSDLNIKKTTDFQHLN